MKLTPFGKKVVSLLIVGILFYNIYMMIPDPDLWACYVFPTVVMMIVDMMYLDVDREIIPRTASIGETVAGYVFIVPYLLVVGVIMLFQSMFERED